MILVTGATGTVGSEVVRQLARAGVRVRALVRDPAKAAALRCANVEVAVADLDRPDTLDAMFLGVERMLLVTSADRRLREIQSNGIAAARRAGVRHVIRVSSVGAGRTSPVPLLKLHGEADEALRRSGLAWTILRSNLHMQNFLWFASSIAHHGVLYAPAGEGRASLVDARDLAAVAAAALTGSGHEGKTYVVTGPAALSGADIAAELAQAIGRSVTYAAVPAARAREELVAGGMAELLADDLLAALSAIYTRSIAAGVTGVVEQLTGRQPRSFGQFVWEYEEAFTDAVAVRGSVR